MISRTAAGWGEALPERVWWALTTDEKAQLAGGTLGGDPGRQVYFAIVQGEFRSGQYQFFSMEADPQSHKKLSYVLGGGFDRTPVGAMATFDSSSAP
jgi:hypothetical protein